MSVVATAVGGALWYKKSRTPIDEEEDTVIDLDPSTNGVTPAEARQEKSRQGKRESELSL